MTQHSSALSSADNLIYTGFWIRFVASFIDALLQVIILIPLLIAIYGWEYFESDKFIVGPMDFFLNYVVPAIVVIVFWTYKQATPGKMAFSARIVDAETGGVPTTAQFVGRYFAYIISALPLGLGFIWVAFDRKKQGWHDKLAGTVVVMPKNTGPDPVTFRP